MVSLAATKAASLPSSIVEWSIEHRIFAQIEALNPDSKALLLTDQLGTQPVTMAEMYEGQCPSFYGRETVRPAFPDKDLPRISYGLQYPEAIKNHVNETLKCKKVYLLVSKSLANATDVLLLTKASLGTSLVGQRIGMTPHTLWTELWDVIQDVRSLDVDLILTIGAGSLTDAAKIVCWALVNDVNSVQDLAILTATTANEQAKLKPPTVKQISVPTTLSGGEYSSFAGATEDVSRVKHMFSPPIQNPVMVILDPQVTLTTPDRVWLSSGIRAVDHCVEGLCSLHCTQEAEDVFVKTLAMLVPALLRCKADPSNLEGRFQAQLGSIDAMRTSTFKIPLGGSHAIGHQLGPFGVGHGETSCVCLPAVCKFNALKEANLDRQRVALSALMRLPEVQDLVGSQTELQLATVLALIIEELGLPRSLTSVGIKKADLDEIALNVTKDPWAATNPVPLTDKSVVGELLHTMFE